MKNVNDQLARTNQAIGTITKSSREMADGATSQAREVSSVTALVDRLNKEIARVSENARTAANAAQRTEVSAAEGAAVVQDVVRGMGSLRANVQAGAQTRVSTILHGIWLLAFVALLPFVLRMIPTSALGAILVYTGYKLVDVKNIKQIRAYGWIPVGIYAATVVTIVCMDLLTGVITGIVLSVLKLVYQITHLEIQTRREHGALHMTLIGAATFVKLPQLASALEAVPTGTEVHLDIHGLAHIDHACLDLMTSWRSRHEEAGGVVKVEWDGLHRRYTEITKSPVLAQSASHGKAQSLTMV